MPRINNNLTAARQAARNQFQQQSTARQNNDRMGVLPGNPMTGGGFQAGNLSLAPRAGGQTGTMPGPWQGDYQPGGPGGMPPQPGQSPNIISLDRFSPGPWQGPGPWNSPAGNNYDFSRMTPGDWSGTAIAMQDRGYPTRQQQFGYPDISRRWPGSFDRVWQGPQPGDRQQPPWQRPQPPWLRTGDRAPWQRPQPPWQGPQGPDRQPQVPSGPWGGQGWDQMFGGADNTSGMVDFARQRGYVSPITQHLNVMGGMPAQYSMQVRPEQRDALNAFMSYMHLNQNQQMPAVQGYNRWGGMGSDIRMPWEQRNPAAPTPNAGSQQGPRIPDWLRPGGGSIGDRNYDPYEVPEGGWGGHSGAYNPDGTPIMNPAQRQYRNIGFAY